MAEKKKKQVKWFWEKEPDEFEQVHGSPHGMRGHFDLMSQLSKQMRALTAGIPINMSETDRELIVQAELPGFKKDEIKLVVTSNTFELNAEKKHEEIERGETFYRKEVGHKSIHRAFALPVEVDADRVSANMEEGVLTVTMPKREAVKKKKKSVEIE